MRPTGQDAHERAAEDYQFTASCSLSEESNYLLLLTCTVFFFFFFAPPTQFWAIVFNEDSSYAIFHFNISQGHSLVAALEVGPFALTQPKYGQASLYSPPPWSDPMWKWWPFLCNESSFICILKNKKQNMARLLFKRALQGNLL
jgi:hypothetical protein